MHVMSCQVMSLEIATQLATQQPHLHALFKKE